MLLYNQRWPKPPELQRLAHRLRRQRQGPPLELYLDGFMSRLAIVFAGLFPLDVLNSRSWEPGKIASHCVTSQNPGADRHVVSADLHGLVEWGLAFSTIGSRAWAELVVDLLV